MVVPETNRTRSSAFCLASGFFGDKTKTDEKQKYGEAPSKDGFDGRRDGKQVRTGEYRKGVHEECSAVE